MPRAIQTEAYWRDEFAVTEEDEVQLQEYFMQQARPLDSETISQRLISQRLEGGSKKRRRAADGRPYDPSEGYEVGHTILFPALEGEMGEVRGVREGNNPRHEPFEVIEVYFPELDETREFATKLAAGTLRLAALQLEPELSPEEVVARFGDQVQAEVAEMLEYSDDFLQVGGRWLPRLMLVHFHEGHANIAEAMVDIMGEPMSPAELLKELTIDEEASAAVKEFSLNHLLQQDERFINVGSEDAPLWHLKRLTQ